jgi:hypothetical protein
MDSFCLSLPTFRHPPPFGEGGEGSVEMYTEFTEQTRNAPKILWIKKQEGIFFSVPSVLFGAFRVTEKLARIESRRA